MATSPSKEVKAPLRDGTHFFLIRSLLLVANIISFFGVLLVPFLLALSFELLRGLGLAGEPAHGCCSGVSLGLDKPTGATRHPTSGHEAQHVNVKVRVLGAPQRPVVGGWLPDDGTSS